MNVEFAVFKNDQPSMVFMSQVSFIEIMMMMAIHQMNSEQSFFSCYILSFEHLGYKFSQQQHYTVFLFLMVPMILNEEILFWIVEKTKQINLVDFRISFGCLTK